MAYRCSMYLNPEASPWKLLPLKNVASYLSQKPQSIENFICRLQQCRKDGKLVNAKEVDAGICNGLEEYKNVGNHIVPAFVECHSISDAQQVFNMLLCRNEHSWTSLISGYVDCGQSQHALTLYQKMQQDNVHPSNHTLTALLKACTRLKDMERGWQIYVQITKNRLDTDVYVGSSLVDMYAKCGSVAGAQEVFDKLATRNIVTWNALVAGYAENGPGEEALRCFEEMQQAGMSPNRVTFLSTLKACCGIGVLVKGREIHAEIPRKQLQSDLVIGNMLIHMYAKCGSLSEAYEVFDQLPVRDIVSWNSIITGCVENGHNQEALKLFEQMELEDILPDAVTIICCLKACQKVDEVYKVHVNVVQEKFERDLSVGNSLISAYARFGSHEDARKIFDKLPIHDIGSWKMLIIGYAENELPHKVLACYDQMRLEGVSPDALILIFSLKACGSLGDIDKGRQIHTAITQQDFQMDVLIGGALVDMYMKIGSVAEAQNVFDKLPFQDAVSWTALIAGYAEHGFSLEALEHFERMQVDAASPDSVTYVCILKTCGTIGSIERGRKIHSEILLRGFGTDTYAGSALVDMYTKCFSLQEALEVFDKLPNRDDVSWNTLMAGYEENGLSHEALKCFEQMLLEGRSPNIVTYICSLKTCAAIGALDKGRHLHAKIKEKGLEEDASAGSSLIDMYAKCGSLSEARKVFNKLFLRDVVVWNAMIRGYGTNHEGRLAIECFKDMQDQGIKPDAITFISLLSSCSRASLVSEGQKYFRMMKEEYGIEPTSHHYTCMVDLLARSGHFSEADKLLGTAACPLSKDTWTALLSACKIYGESEVALRCFEQLVQMNPGNSAPYVLMASIYGSAGRMEEAKKIEELRKHAGAKKMPAKALIEVNEKVHEFVVGDEQSQEILAMLESLNSRIREEGYASNLDLVWKPVSDEEKEASLCGHAEKLAIAFGLLHTPQGQTLHMSKNLRMCNNCHSASKIIARIERREIILRESNWVHHFKDGLCSCQDMW